MGVADIVEMQVSPAKAPQVVGALLDVEAPDDFITNLILSIRSLIPVEALCAEVRSPKDGLCLSSSLGCWPCSSSCCACLPAFSDTCASASGGCVGLRIDLLHRRACRPSCTMAHYVPAVSIQVQALGPQSVHQGVRRMTANLT